jgi:hypothetical protein
VGPFFGQTLTECTSTAHSGAGDNSHAALKSTFETSYLHGKGLALRRKKTKFDANLVEDIQDGIKMLIFVCGHVARTHH